MTNKEFAFKYAGKEFMHCGDRVKPKTPGECIAY